MSQLPYLFVSLRPPGYYITGDGTIYEKRATTHRGFMTFVRMVLGTPEDEDCSSLKCCIENAYESIAEDLGELPDEPRCCVFIDWLEEADPLEGLPNWILASPWPERPDETGLWIIHTFGPFFAGYYPDNGELHIRIYQPGAFPCEELVQRAHLIADALVYGD